MTDSEVRGGEESFTNQREMHHCEEDTAMPKHKKKSGVSKAAENVSPPNTTTAPKEWILWEHEIGSSVAASVHPAVTAAGGPLPSRVTELSHFFHQQDPELAGDSLLEHLPKPSQCFFMKADHGDQHHHSKGKHHHHHEAPATHKEFSLFQKGIHPADKADPANKQGGVLYCQQYLAPEFLDHYWKALIRALITGQLVVLAPLTASKNSQPVPQHVVNGVRVDDISEGKHPLYKVEVWINTRHQRIRDLVRAKVMEVMQTGEPTVNKKHNLKLHWRDFREATLHQHQHANSRSSSPTHSESPRSSSEWILWEHHVGDNKEDGSKSWKQSTSEVCHFFQTSEKFQSDLHHLPLPSQSFFLKAQDAAAMGWHQKRQHHHHNNRHQHHGGRHHHHNKKHHRAANYSHTEYSLFKKGIQPEWEDPHNADGGLLFCRRYLPPQCLDLYWTSLVRGLIQGRIDDEHVNGVRIDDKSKDGNALYKIEIWLNVAHDEQVRDRIRNQVIQVITEHEPMDGKKHRLKLQWRDFASVLNKSSSSESASATRDRSLSIVSTDDEDDQQHKKAAPTGTESPTCIMTDLNSNNTVQVKDSRIPDCPIPQTAQVVVASS